MKLVSDWKSSWRWFSVFVPTINVAFIATWATLPARFQDAIPEQWVVGAAVMLIVLGVVGRLIDQDGVVK